MLAPYLRPPSNPFLEFFFFFFSRSERYLPMHWGTFSAQTRTERRLMWMTDVPRKLTVTTRAIFPPLSSVGLERKISRRRGWIYSIDGVRKANSHASWTNKDRHAPCAIPFSGINNYASALSALKKMFGRQTVR